MGKRTQHIRLRQTVPGTLYYYCNITFATGGCSSITSDIGAIIVNPDPTISTQPLATQTICVGGPIDQALTVSYTAGVGIPSYQWQVDGVDISWGDKLNLSS